MTSTVVSSLNFIGQLAPVFHLFLAGSTMVQMRLAGAPKTLTGRIILLMANTYRRTIILDIKLPNMYIK